MATYIAEASLLSIIASIVQVSNASSIQLIEIDELIQVLPLPTSDSWA